jgi:hypothetical protein
MLRSFGVRHTYLEDRKIGVLQRKVDICERQNDRVLQRKVNISRGQEDWGSAEKGKHM